MLLLSGLRCAGLCVCSFPALAKRGYDFLKDQKGFSDMAIIAGERAGRALTKGRKLGLLVVAASH